MNTKAFTLIELLVVIAILAVLAVAVTLILNPAELIRQGRDSIRLSDLATINKALGLYQTDQIAQWMGTSTIVYTSLPDTDSTCSSYGLPSLPSGWTYNCQTTTTYTNVDGTGWLPVNFTSMSFSSPLARLPVDPVNNATSSKYYTYVSGGSWKLSAIFESETRAADAADDGGVDPATYETGTDLELAPFTHGLTGYWKFDESGTTVTDSSGYGNNGTMYSSSTITDLHTSSGCKKGSCVTFDGIDDYIQTINDYFDITNTNFPEVTLSCWIKSEPGGKALQGIVGEQNFNGGGSSTDDTGLYRYSSASTRFSLNTRTHNRTTVSTISANSEWQHIVATYNGTTLKIYKNETEEDSSTSSGYVGISGGLDRPFTIGLALSTSYTFKGLIDDIRIYNRALSAAEVEAMYNSY